MEKCNRTKKISAFIRIEMTKMLINTYCQFGLLKDQKGEKVCLWAVFTLDSRVLIEVAKKRSPTMRARSKINQCCQMVWSTAYSNYILYLNKFTEGANEMLISMLNRKIRVWKSLNLVNYYIVNISSSISYFCSLYCC